MPGGVRLVLVRHGESEWNAAGRLQGHAGSGLSPQGRVEAELTARRFATWPGVVAIVRSDLPRVAETSEPTEALLDVPVKVDPRLREIDLGTWSGLTWDEVAERDPDGYEGALRGEDVRRGGGETFEELHTRVESALLDLVATWDSGTVLVFTHGGCIRVAAASALGIPREAHRRLAPVRNGSLTVLVWSDGHVRLERYNDAAHLEAPVNVAPETL